MNIDENTNTIQQKINQKLQANSLSLSPIFPALDAANPILPPGSYYQNPLSLRMIYRYSNERENFSQTQCSAVLKQKQRVWKKTPNAKSEFIEKLQLINEDQFNQAIHQFHQFIQSRKLVYQRIHNDKLNVIGSNKCKIYSSVFFNCNNIRQKNYPIYEHLSKLNKTKIYSLQPQRLIFNSAFESGNLFSAFKTESSLIQTYELFLQNDTNTKGCTQWFYFSVLNNLKGKIKFRIMNFYKPTSLFSKGMKILCSKDNIEWKRTGIAIQYGSMNITDHFSTYFLQFVYDFDKTQEITYFSYGFPYDYSTHLTGFINDLEEKKRLIHRQVLCESNMGNNVYLLSIHQNRKIIKPIIYIISRQHPGETPSSFIMEGIIGFLISSRIEAEQLRNTFDFRIVPMVNVDGVISGNYRSNCSGNDVNRQWDFPSKKKHPQIYYLKKQIMANKKNVVFFLDIHAHSRKMNSFFYGNKSHDGDNKFYPFICSKLCKLISYDESSFGDDPSKKTTGRVVIQNELQLKNSLTFEVSFYGWQERQKGTKHHFKVKDFHQIGQNLGLAFFYSQIAIKTFINLKNNPNQQTLLMKNNKQKDRATSCKLQNKKLQNKNEWKQISKNCSRIYNKWKKALQLQNDNGDQCSEGSSIDPQHFQLRLDELASKQKYQKFSKQKQVLIHNKAELFNENSVMLGNNIKNQITWKHNSKRKQVLEKGDKNYQLKFKEEKQEFLSKGRGQSLIVRGEKQTILTDPIQSKVKDSYVVKQLQQQLQIQKNKYQKSGMKRKEKLLNLQQVSHYKSLQKESLLNYRYNVQKIKKTLHYFLDSNNTSKNEQYTQCFKNYRHEDIIMLNQNSKKIQPLCYLKK